MPGPARSSDVEESDLAARKSALERLEDFVQTGKKTVDQDERALQERKKALSEEEKELQTRKKALEWNLKCLEEVKRDLEKDQKAAMQRKRQELTEVLESMKVDGDLHVALDIILDLSKDIWMPADLLEHIKLRQQHGVDNEAQDGMHSETASTANGEDTKTEKNLE
ncbi:uncharacterized protein BKA78DRAFT_348530 [Phyllosticta capitalensis]|uniref:uncharacterized protein n=1 Tax=Phyllosticta capitalensis TaxID=121624 RepID=UPI0031315F84